MSVDTVDQLGKTLAQSFSISLIMQQSPTENPWIDSRWEAIGILASDKETEGAAHQMELIQEESGVHRYLYRGYHLRLHVDECESYYHNLLAPSPCCYVVATLSDDGVPQPMLLSLSFDEAHAYLEGEETIYTVPIPPEIYQWTEAFVLANYVPEKRIKRARQDWRRNAGNKQP